MRKIIFVLLVVLLLNFSLVNAITPQEIDEAKGLIDSGVDCKILSDSQLEIIGEYYMEQMHPRESHELMHKMMGLEEGSKDEEQFHINMAKTTYCGGDSGMMSSSNMMGSGIMNMMLGGGNMVGGNTGYGMMGYGLGYWNFINILYIILLIGLIILVYFLSLKLWRNMKNKDTRK